MPLFFWGGGFFIFVLRSKRKDMLKGITWGQFSEFMLVVTGIYYLYVGLRYYRAELLGWVTGRGGRAPGFSGVGDKGNNKGSPEGPAPKVPADQAELFEMAGLGEGNQQFRQVQRAIGVIRQVITQGIENKLDRENLLDHIREVLVDYRKLRKTEYAVTINNYLIRVCASELSLELGEQDLAALWK